MGQFEAGIPVGLQPTGSKDQLYNGNYINFLDGNHQQWLQQFLPDVYENEAERYGDRRISAFLKMVGAEMASSSDQIIWREQGRLHTRYVNLTASAASGTDLPTGATAASLPGISAGEYVTFTSTAADQPQNFGADAANNSENPYSSGAKIGFGEQIIYRVGETVMIQVQGSASSATANAGVGTGDVLKGIITSAGTLTFTVLAYNTVGSEFTATADCTSLVYGSEFGKGTGNMNESIDPSWETYSNAPIIMKDHYAINGSDTSAIGWVEISGADGGPGGYLWYMKAEAENKMRWEDKLEMAMVEAIPLATGASGTLPIGRGNAGVNGHSARGANNAARGTEGLFHALETRGNVYEGFGDEAGGGGALTDFDTVLKQLDKQGSIRENMMYLNRDLSLEIDDILAQISGSHTYGGGGASFGAFNNSSDMALNLGFKGFTRGSYDFYKTDWRYLNDWSTRGGFGDIEGVLVPVGTSKVYDGSEGGQVKRPFLHVRYRASETENRKMKSWITGSVGGAFTTDVDEMRIHYLTERCLITQAPNNFILFKG